MQRSRRRREGLVEVGGMRLPGPVAFTAAALASRVGEGASDGIDDAPLLSVRLPVPRVPARARTFAVSRASRRACRDKTLALSVS